MTLDDFDPAKVLVEDQRKNPDIGPNAAERVVLNVRNNWRLGGVRGILGIPYAPAPIRSFDGTAYNINVDKLVRRALPATPVRRAR